MLSKFTDLYILEESSTAKPEGRRNSTECGGDYSRTALQRTKSLFRSSVEMQRVCGGWAEVSKGPPTVCAMQSHRGAGRSKAFDETAGKQGAAS